MTQQRHGPNSRFERQAAAARPPAGPGRTTAARKADRAPAVSAVLDRLREAAAAHDGELPALEVPEALSRRSA
jgi:hypothetical protein